MTDETYAELHHAANWARAILIRCSGDGGILEQIAAGGWDQDRTPDQARDLAAMIRALGEHARYARAFGGGQSHQLDDVPHATTVVEHAATTRLPMNRKEQYFTGTVLPMVVASDGFAYLDRFLDLCGMPVHVQPGRGGDQDIQFFTEYGFAESVFTRDDLLRWPDLAGKVTPDVVLTGPDWLLAVEAKMYHNPNAAALSRQMRDQRLIVRAWRERLGLPEEQVRHVLLLPRRLFLRVDPVDAQVVLWEDILAAYRAVGPAHWVAVLAAALRRHEELESRGPVFGQYADAKMTGAEIHAAHGDGPLAFDFVGRAGGVNGDRFREDVATGRWRTTAYEVRSGARPGNPNWFPVGQFLASTAVVEAT